MFATASTVQKEKVTSQKRACRHFQLIERIDSRSATEQGGINTDSRTLCVHPGVYIQFVGVYTEFVNQCILSNHIEQPCITKERKN